MTLKPDYRTTINNQVSLLKNGIELLDSRLDEIDCKGREGILDDAEIVILIAKKDYVDFFKRIMVFLCSKLETDEEKNFVFYIPNVRALIEIYAHILHLSFESKEKQLTLIFYNMFSTISKMVSSKTKKMGVNEEYSNQYKHFESILKKFSINIPADPTKLTNSYATNNGLDYPNVFQMLNKERILSSSPLTSVVFPLDQGDPYLLYGQFSNYVHGNILHKMSLGRENFWIISKSLILTAQIIELIDLKILDKGTRPDVRYWLKKIDSSKVDFLAVWKSLQVEQ